MEEIPNVEEGSLPMTGGKGILMLVVVGVVSGIVGLFIAKRARMDNDELY
jgi:LPXTG-motif cell wall-anchored protein